MNHFLNSILDLIIEVFCRPILGLRGFVAVQSKKHDAMKFAAKALIEFDLIRKKGFPSEILQASINLNPSIEAICSVNAVSED
jgi:hypothetical protein